MMTTHSPATRHASTRPARQRITRWCGLIIVLLLGLSGLAAAQECTYELEPNDTPATATLITGVGPDSALPPGDGRTPIACFSGEISGNDQDAFLWEIGEAEANQHWVIDLEGVPGHLTRLDIISVTFADNGVDVTRADELFTVASPDGRTVTSTGFLMAPGRYVIGISTSGGSGSYVVNLRPQQALTRYSRAADRSSDLNGEFSVTGAVFDELDVTWTLSEDDAAFVWGLLLEAALGSQPELILTGPNGIVNKLRADKNGTARLSSLGLAAGQYQVQVLGSSGTFRLSSSRQGRMGNGIEVEPNNNFESATVFPLDSSMKGHISDVDHFRIPVDATHAGSAWSLSLEAAGNLSMELRNDAGQRLFYRRGANGTIDGLVLTEGDYNLVIDGDRGTDYTLALRSTTAPATGWEIEPNDTAVSATLLGADLKVRGNISTQDFDMFRVELSGEAQLYRIQLVGSDIKSLTVSNGAAQEEASVSGSKRLRLDNLVLLAGTHYLTVRGDSGEYALQVLPLGPVPAASEQIVPAADEPLAAAPAAAVEQSSDDAADAPATATLPPLPPPPPGVLELEPNDDATRADVLEPGVTRVGSLSSLADIDNYRFHLTNDQYVRIELIPPADSGPIPFYLPAFGWVEATDQEPGTPTIMERWLLAGDHRVEIRRAETPGSYYQLRLTQLDSALLPVDAEPNNDRDTAGRLPAELAWTGSAGGQGSGDYDWFLLPRFSSPTTINVTITSENNSANAYLLDATTYLDTAHARDSDIWTAELPANEDSWLQLRGSGGYQVSVEFSSAPDPAQLLPARATSPLTIDLSVQETEVAAFWHEGQTVNAAARVTNNSDTAQTVTLQAATTDARIQLELPAPLELAAGASSDLPVQVRIPADLRDDLPLRISIAASSSAGISSNSVSLQARCEVNPVNSAAWWPLPEALLGGIDVLWDSLGAELHGDSGYAHRDRVLLDGRTNPATFGFTSAGNIPTFKLAGAQPSLLSGAILHPQVGASVADQLKRFRIETSLDGVTFTPVLEADLLAARIEQAFVFPQPVQASYARLVFVSAQGGGNSGYLGEFKLITQDAAQFGELNLADLKLGGHVVWSEPRLSSRGEGLLDASNKATRLDMRDFDDFTFVLGFHNGRAAQLDRIEWHEFSDAISAGETFPAASIEVSLNGPIGPWTPLADWTFERDATGTATLEFTEPIWARYLRFTAAAPEGQRHAHAPQALRVIERAAQGDYRSALGEWGHAAPAGILEYLQPPISPAITEAAGNNDTRETATALASGSIVEGTVEIGHDIDWYRLTIKPGENHLQIRLSGEPTIEYIYTLEDSAGQPVAFDLARSNEAEILSLYGEPGDYYLKIEEPKRTVVFSWDTSGSMGPYQTITYNALAGFAREVDSEREAVQLLAYDDNPGPRWLLPIWSGDTERVQRAINNFNRKADSSNSESALLVASRALADRDGTRAIMLVTDAETDGYGLTPQLWRSFEDVQPRIFTFEVSSGGSLYSQQLMQDWAAVNYGFYDLATSVGDLDAGFNRASCILRRPKHYRIEVTSSSAALPGPGSLSVKRPADAAQPAVEIIFDASGSMGVPLPNGEQRITVAKRVLEELVTEVLPEGSPFALRAFGHVKPTTCDTRLEVPLGPLDRAAALKAVRAIEPKLLSQTPLAESLAAVAEDLARAGRSRTVILITDGEESCGGDPADAVRELRARHPLDLAIVSLGLEAEERERFEALAESVGASYVDVTTFEQLQASVDDALHPGFEVLDTDGRTVASGLVDGAPVELPMGVYTVRVQGMPVQEFRAVRVPGEKEVTVTIAAQ